MESITSTLLSLAIISQLVAYIFPIRLSKGLTVMSLWATITDLKVHPLSAQMLPTLRGLLFARLSLAVSLTILVPMRLLSLIPA
jgi:hypothetical protein